MFLVAPIIRLLNRYGQTLTLTKTSGGTYNNSTGTLSGVTTTTKYVKGYFYNDSRSGNQDSIDGDRNLILQQVDIYGNSYTAPDIGDHLSGVRDEVTLVKVDHIYTGSSLVCYLCKVKE